MTKEKKPLKPLKLRKHYWVIGNIFNGIVWGDADPFVFTDKQSAISWCASRPDCVFCEPRKVIITEAK